MNTQDNIHWTDDPELLAQYALGHIEEARRQLFDDHLAVCDACRIAVQREKELAAGIRLAGRQQLKERLRNGIKIAEPNFLRRYQLASLAAAIIVISIGIGFFRFYFGSFEWPTKFSSRKYILKQTPSDSTNPTQEFSHADKPAHEIAEAEKKEPESENQEPPALADNLAPRSVSGAGGNSQIGLGELEKVETATQPPTQSRAIWLLGTITVVSDARGSTAMPQALSRARDENAAKGKLESKQYGDEARTLTIRKDALSQIVTLFERPLSLLPQSQQSQYSPASTVQTFVEQTQKGLTITMYRDVPTVTSQIHNATIEPVTDDSLIVTMGNERVAYRIPGGWASSSKTNNERR